jgi:hypothetical protein
MVPSAQLKRMVPAALIENGSFSPGVENGSPAQVYIENGSFSPDKKNGSGSLCIEKGSYSPGVENGSPAQV